MISAESLAIRAHLADIDASQREWQQQN